LKVEDGHRVAPYWLRDVSAGLILYSLCCISNFNKYLTYIFDRQHRIGTAQDSSHISGCAHGKASNTINSINSSRNRSINSIRNRSSNHGKRHSRSEAPGKIRDS
jgi:hypothetical protein